MFNWILSIISSKFCKDKYCKGGEKILKTNEIVILPFQTGIIQQMRNKLWRCVPLDIYTSYYACGSLQVYKYMKPVQISICYNTLDIRKYYLIRRWE